MSKVATKSQPQYRNEDIEKLISNNNTVEAYPPQHDQAVVGTQTSADNWSSQKKTLGSKDQYFCKNTHDTGIP